MIHNIFILFYVYVFMLDLIPNLALFGKCFLGFSLLISSDLAKKAQWTYRFSSQTVAYIVYVVSSRNRYSDQRLSLSCSSLSPSIWIGWPFENQGSILGRSPILGYPCTLGPLSCCTFHALLFSSLFPS